MVNINIEIPDELHKRLKLASLLEDKTLKEYVISVLEAAVQQDAGTKAQHEDAAGRRGSAARKGRSHE